MSKPVSPKLCCICGDDIKWGINYNTKAPFILGAGSRDAVFISFKEGYYGIERRCDPCGGGSRSFKYNRDTDETTYRKELSDW